MQDKTTSICVPVKMPKRMGCSDVNSNLPPQPKVSMEVPPEKLEALKAYAAKLHKKYPKWSQGRVARKTAEYFKLKLV